MRTSILTILFFTITPIAIAASFLSLFSIQEIQKKETLIAPKYDNFLKYPKPGIKVYASLPEKVPSISANVISEDARSEIVKKYLSTYYSPLKPFAENIVKASDKYNLDFRLTTAIAQQESNLCKKIPLDSFNCWGWGIHSQGTLGFQTYEEGIEAVSYGLRSDYFDKGFTSIDEIMTKYTPLSKGSWALGVKKFMEEME